jgi:esterase/lipase superfamily enzyme
VEITRRVLYATDRHPAAPTTQETLPRDDCKFQEVRNPRGLTYGVALIASPITVTNYTKPEHFACLHIEPLEGADKIEQKAVQLAQQSFGDLFLYVHGYGTTLGRAAEVAAFMSTSFSIKSVPMIFSWPSKKPGMLTYLSAEEQLEESRENLKSVLKLTGNFQSANAHVLGHSLGARGVLEAIAELHSNNTSNLKRIRRLILAAADISGLTCFGRDSQNRQRRWLYIAPHKTLC